MPSYAWERGAVSMMWLPPFLPNSSGAGALEPESLTSDDVTPEQLSHLDMAGVRIVVLSYMNEDSITHAKYLIRRLRRRAAGNQGHRSGSGR